MFVRTEKLERGHGRLVGEEDLKWGMGRVRWKAKAKVMQRLK